MLMFIMKTIKNLLVDQTRLKTGGKVCRIGVFEMVS
jgi:hypothetical protein